MFFVVCFISTLSLSITSFPLPLSLFFNPLSTTFPLPLFLSHYLSTPSQPLSLSFQNAANGSGRHGHEGSAGQTDEWGFSVDGAHKVRLNRRVKTREVKRRQEKRRGQERSEDKRRQEDRREEERSEDKRREDRREEEKRGVKRSRRDLFPLFV